MGRKAIFILTVSLLVTSCTNLQEMRMGKQKDAVIEIIDTEEEDQFVDAVIEVIDEDGYKVITESEIDIKDDVKNDTIVSTETSTPKLPETNVSEVEDGITEIVLNGIDQVDILDKKIGKNKIAYVKGKENKPFTGTFISFIGLHKSYSEEYKDGKLNGRKIWYAENGSVGVEEPYVNNRKHGTQITYHLSNAKVRSKINYVNGLLEGNIEWFDESGKLIDKKTITKGTGTYVSYWSNGRLREKGQYKAHRRDGKWERYTETGVLEKLDIYNNGRLSRREWRQ